MDSNNISKKGKEELNQIKLKNILNSIKSNYILKIIFNHLNKKKLLEMVKYNKIYKQRLNISINDYKEYSELYSSIVIEIIPLKERHYFYGIINYKEKDKSYYHIYFDNNPEEIPRRILFETDKITKIKIKIDYPVKSFYGAFDFCQCIDSINFKKFYRNNITNMSYMFHKCYKLQELTLNIFNASNVTDMSDMFSKCYNLNKLNFSIFNINSATKMGDIFSECYSLQEINISIFNTISETNMNNKFSYCITLNVSNPSNFYINEIFDISHMFSESKTLKKLNISSCNTNKENVECIFQECSSLNEVDLSNFKGDDRFSRIRIFSDCPDQIIKKIKAHLNKINK